MAKVQLGLHGLPQSKGEFQLRGELTGLKRDKFFVADETNKEKERRICKFGVKTSLESEVYVQLGDKEQDNVYFYNKDEKNTAPVSWAKRKEFSKDGYQLIGCNFGLEKETDDKGNEVNLKLSKHAFDGAEYLNELAKEEIIKDGDAVFVVGKLEFSSFEGDKGMVRFKKFDVNKMYNSSVDFIADDFEEVSKFKQQFIYMGSEMKEDESGKFLLVKGLTVTYFGFEEVEFKVRNKKLAQNMNKRLKAYSNITCHGVVLNTRDEEVVETSDEDWGGEADSFDQVGTPRKFELLIKGIDTKDIDTTTFTKKIVDEAQKADEDFGVDSNSGDWDSDNKDDDDDGEW